MNIAFLHFYTFRLPRGIETLVISVANELIRKGHSVTILTAKSRTKHEHVVLDPAVQVHEFPTFRYFEHQTIAPFYLWDLLRNNYDIVNIFFADFGETFPIKTAMGIKSFLLNIYICYGQP